MSYVNGVTPLYSHIILSDSPSLSYHVPQVICGFEIYLSSFLARIDKHRQAMIIQIHREGRNNGQCIDIYDKQKGPIGYIHWANGEITPKYKPCERKTNLTDKAPIRHEQLYIARKKYHSESLLLIAETRSTLSN